ncbi:MAG: sialate O-acetylesterase [Clostridiales bacterium]|nr:sialate O-acetylesterase [Clostridiales bacterium]
MDKKKLLKAGLASMLCLTIGGVVVACSDGSGDGGKDDQPPVTHEITATIANTNIEVGKNESISLDVETLEGEEFTCVTDKSGVIFYDAKNGKIIGVSEGTVNMTFTVKGKPSITKTITITVVAPTTQYEVIIGDSEPINVMYGHKIEKPADPVKESTVSTVYTFDCWVKEGTDIEWDFDTPVTGPVVLEAKWTESARKYTVTVGGEEAEYEYNSKITAPADPDDYTTETKIYTFEYWKNTATGEKWNFNVDKVISDGIVLEPYFSEADRTFAVDVEIASNQVNLGAKQYYTYEFSEAEIEAMNVVLTDGTNEYKVDGAVEVLPGTYTVKLTYNGVEYTKEVVVGANNENKVAFALSTSKLNGSVGGFSSFAHGSKKVVSGEEVWLGYYDYTYQDKVQGSEYYIESYILFEPNDGKTNANLVGLMPAVCNEDLSSNGAGKLIVGVTQAGKLAYTIAGGWGSKAIEIADVSDKITTNGEGGYAYKLGVYRNGADFAIFVNNEYIDTISIGMFEECGFGVGSMADNQSNGYTKFVEFKYSFNEELLSDLYDASTNENDIEVTAIFDTDYAIANGRKVYYQDDITYDQAKRVTLEIYNSDNELVKTVYTAERKFDIVLAPGAYKAKATFAGTKGTTVKESEFMLVKSSRSFVFDLSITDVGGSYTLPNGTKVDSFGQNYTFPTADSISVSDKTYAYINGVTGSTYYIEATITKKEKGWHGFILNSSEGAPTNGFKKVAVGVYDDGNGTPSLYVQRSIEHNWGTGIGMGSVASYTGTGSTYKLAALRVNNKYTLYINGTVVWSETIDSLTKDGKILPADNISGFGIFRGLNFNPSAPTLKDIKYTTNLEAINAIFKGVNATLECDDSVSVVSGDRVVKNGGSVYGIEGTTKKVKVEVPEGKVISYLSIQVNGKEQKVSYAPDGSFMFDLTEWGKIVVDVEFEEAKETTLTLSYASAFVEKDGKKIALYDLSDINPADIEVEVINVYGGKTESFVFDGTSKTLNVNTGTFKINFVYKNNLWSKDIVVGEDGAEVVGLLSDVYLGGAITFTTNTGAQTTIKSFDKAEVGSTSGNGWALVDGYRNNISTSSYTFAFQNEVVGSKYYLEGVFDSTQTSYSMYDNKFSGLLIAHVNDTALDGNGHSKSVAYIKNDSVVLGTTDTWSLSMPITIANYKDVLGEGNYDPTAVKLGVLRNGTDFYFFVNDVFVAYRKIDTYGNNVSGFGVASNVVNNVISNFNYTTNEQALNEITSGIQVTNRSIDIYLIAGQSNAAGYTNFNSVNLLPLDEHYIYGYQNIMYAGNAESSANNYTTTVDHEHPWSLLRAGQGAGTGKIGPEIGMANVLSSYYNVESGKQAGFIKFAHGGTCLLDSITGENKAGGNWVSPSYEATITPKSPGKLTGGLYRSLLEQVEKNIGELKAMGYSDINVKGLYWMQGESDKGNPTEYLKAFKYFASDVRSDLTKICGQDLSKMPILIGEISRTSGSAVQGTVSTNNAFIAMQRTIPDHVNDTYVIAAGDYDINKLVNGSNTAVGTDSWHWNYKDHIEIGKLVGNCILDNILD